MHQSKCIMKKKTVSSTPVVLLLMSTKDKNIFSWKIYLRNNQLTKIAETVRIPDLKLACLFT